MSRFSAPSPGLTGSERERYLSEAFVRLADSLVDDYDVVELLDHLVETTVELLGVTAAGLLLVDERGSLAVVATSKEAGRVLEVLQLQSAEGPCLDSVRSGSVVHSGDLASESRWPLFTATALAADFGSVAAVPLRLRDSVVGGLNLFDRRRRRLPEADLVVAQALADVATIAVLQRRSVDAQSLLADQLQHALNSRVVIEQAKGVLAERLGVDMDSAYRSLRRHCRNTNSKLTDVALAVVSGEPVELSPAS
jgi:GAF domain-containing protein